MGVNLSKLITKKIISLNYLRGKFLAVDANNELYQFLALIRKPDGTPFTDNNGNITSHLIGLVFRTTRLISEYGIKLVFVFDGKPPELKEEELKKRKRIKEKAMLEWINAIKEKDYIKAFSKSVMTSKLTNSMIEDAKKLLKLLGIPYVQAPSEAEAQAAYMTLKGDVWACATRDYDALLFGATRIVRYIQIKGFEFLPSKGIMKPLKPELINLNEVLNNLGINREQLIDLAILIGTDYNEGIKGIGPKKALELIKKYKKLENLPENIKIKLPYNINEIRNLFLNPPISNDYKLEIESIDEKGLYEFLIEEKNFSKKTLETVIKRMKNSIKLNKQTDFYSWI